MTKFGEHEHLIKAARRLLEVMDDEGTRAFVARSFGRYGVVGPAEDTPEAAIDTYVSECIGKAETIGRNIPPFLLYTAPTFHEMASTGGVEITHAVR